MKFALECKLFMIKPNKEELMRLTGKSGSIEDLIELCDKKEIKYGFLTDGYSRLRRTLAFWVWNSESGMH